MDRHDLLPALAVCVAAALYCFHYGRVGFMPLDHSIVFDGGWRILSGQVPFRDFFTPCGIVPSVVQAVWFRSLGVDWLAYCLHAAFTNGLFAVLSYWILRSAGGGRRLALFYAVLSGVVFQPPVGVPYPDQYGWLFTVLAVQLAWVAARSSRPAFRFGLLAALPTVVLLGLLSKQIPMLFGAAIALACVLGSVRSNWQRLRSTLGALIVGALVPTAALTLLLGRLGAAGSSPGRDLWRFTSEVGLSRFAQVFGRDELRRVIRLFSTWYTGIPLTLTLVLGLAALLLVRRRSSLPTGGVERSGAGRCAELGAPLLAIALPALSIAFVALTHNHRANGVPVLFLGFGLAEIATVGAARGSRSEAGRAPWFGALDPRVVVSAALAAIALTCAAGFDRAVNATRQVNDIRVDRPAARSSWALQAMEPLVWIVPSAYSSRVEDVEGVVAYFREHEGGFLLLGDTTILYALTGRASLSPVLWFHPGLTYPGPGSPGFAAFEQRLLDALEEGGARYLVLESVKGRSGMTNGWMEVSVEDFPNLSRRMRSRGVERARIGPFTIVELLPGFAEAEP